jgi:UTP--glucose-1-phosphate uridylyltransferase
MAIMERTIRKAVFPAAGLGTRFLPATKVLPKEMLVLVDKPVIQYGVEEAVQPLGLGHAVLVSRSVVGNEPFAVLLSDDVIDAKPPALKQLVDVYNRVGGPVIAVETVPYENVSSYGVVAIDESADLGPDVFRITDLVEKPPRNEAPSNLAIIGRYVLTPDVFPALEATASDRTGEIQLTNGLRHLLRDRPLYACRVSGTRHDTGNKLGFIKASVYFAMQRPDLAEPLRKYWETL